MHLAIPVTFRGSNVTLCGEAGSVRQFLEQARLGLDGVFTVRDQPLGCVPGAWLATNTAATATCFLCYR